MKMKLYDINLHLDRFKSPFSILTEYSFFNINYIITLCDNIESYFFIKQIQKKKDKKKLLLGLGLHPNKEYSVREVEKIVDLISKETDIIGECGLDFVNKKISNEIQLKNLKKQLNIAEKQNKILILHVLKAEKEILEVLNSYNLNHVIFHWYSGKKSYINEILENNFFFSFNNCILNFKKYQDYLLDIPLKNILLESDAPYDFRGKITKPEDFPKIIEKIANIKSKSVDYVWSRLYTNFKEIFLHRKDNKKKNTRKGNITLDDFL